MVIVIKFLLLFCTVPLVGYSSVDVAHWNKELSYYYFYFHYNWIDFLFFGEITINVEVLYMLNLCHV